MTIQDTSENPDKKFTEVNTIELERRNTPPKDERQHKIPKAQEAKTCQTKENIAKNRNNTPTQTSAPKMSYVPNNPK